MPNLHLLYIVPGTSVPATRLPHRLGKLGVRVDALPARQNDTLGLALVRINPPPVKYRIRPRRVGDVAPVLRQDRLVSVDVVRATTTTSCRKGHARNAQDGRCKRERVGHCRDVGGQVQVQHPDQVELVGLVAEDVIFLERRQEFLVRG